MQVSRLGNPLVNEVVIPVEAEGQVQPHDSGRDAELYGKFVVKPELAAVLNALFGVEGTRDEPRGHRPGGAAGAPGS